MYMYIIPSSIYLFILLKEFAYICLLCYILDSCSWHVQWDDGGGTGRCTLCYPTLARNCVAVYTSTQLKHRRSANAFTR